MNGEARKTAAITVVLKDASRPVRISIVIERTVARIERSSREIRGGLAELSRVSA